MTRKSLERRTFLRASALSTGLLATGVPVASAASPLRVQILLYEGVEELDSIAPYDVLSIAASMGGAIRRHWCRPPSRP
ncbi:twin-arginine translocation signal domain-containing protein [Amycolatopsis vastitatis]|uniref:twin-arginine translocation signal domain-containing protein n=1 Tax=Amycolatopsis vastitatis TaxID=1905142 RepID=UPI001F0B5E33|nr:twin-arginine translocation signal domain-containing protein [Amycolatopsis vastitatis]